MLEKGKQEKIRKWLLGQPFPIRVRRLADRYTRGYPDLQAFFRYSGHLVLLEIECKSEDGKESAIQKAEGELCNAAAGCREGLERPFPFGKYVRVVARSVGDVQASLRQHGIILE